MCLRCGEMVNHLPRNEQHMRYTSIFMNGLTELNSFLSLLPQGATGAIQMHQLLRYPLIIHSVMISVLGALCMSLNVLESLTATEMALMIDTSYIVESSI